MTIILNGDVRPLTAGLTLTQLVEQLGLAGQRVAIERNGTIVPRSQHAQTLLADGDRIEIVKAIGGG